MKVVFDAFWWADGPPSLRHVLREIVLAWSTEFPDDELTLVVRRAALDSARLSAPTQARLVTTSLWPQALAATSAVTRAANSVGAELVLTHNFAARIEGAVSAVFLHDVLFATNPEWFTPVERAYFSLMRRWVHRADLVFTSTESEAGRIRRNCEARAVVPVGIGLSTELTETEQEDEPDADLAPMSFLLTVGRLNARKNLATTIDAALESGLVSPRRPLLVVGSADGRRGGLSPRARAAIATGAVRFTGFVDEARLRWYYRNAALFVFLSLGEGFGMPPVEAAHFGSPVVVSDLPVFRQTLAGHATFVDPLDAAAAASAMRSVAAMSGASPGSALRRSAASQLASRHNWRQTVRSMRAAALECRDRVAA